MIKWADEQFVYRIKKGSAPKGKPKYGKERARYERIMWCHHLLAWGIGSLIMLGLIWLTNDNSRTGALAATINVWGMIVAIDFAVSFSYSVWEKKEKGV